MMMGRSGFSLRQSLLVAIASLLAHAQSADASRLLEASSFQLNAHNSLHDGAILGTFPSVAQAPAEHARHRCETGAAYCDAPSLTLVRVTSMMHAPMLLK